MLYNGNLGSLRRDLEMETQRLIVAGLQQHLPGGSLAGTVEISLQQPSRGGVNRGTLWSGTVGSEVGCHNRQQKNKLHRS